MEDNYKGTGPRWGRWEAEAEKDAAQLACWLMVVVAALLLIGVVVGCNGCASTVTPKPVVDRVASWDGTNQNSGLVDFAADGSGIVTDHARDRYNALVVVYGERFAPRLAVDAGVRPYAPGLWLMDQEHLVKFATMNRWRKSKQ